jgi:hypothetical protein
MARSGRAVSDVPAGPASGTPVPAEAIEAAADAMTPWRLHRIDRGDVLRMAERALVAAAPVLAAAERAKITRMLYDQVTILRESDFSVADPIAAAALEDFADLLAAAPDSPQPHHHEVPHW